MIIESALTRGGQVSNLPVRRVAFVNGEFRQQPAPNGCAAKPHKSSLRRQRLIRTSRLPESPRAAGLRTSRGLTLLRDAWDCAHEMNLDPWQLAVEIEVLRSSGLTNTDLRWLLSQGLSEHRLERTRASDRTRRFARSSSMSLGLSPHDCFILTEAGCQFASRTSPGVTRGAPPMPTAPAPASPRPARRHHNGQFPVWDDMLHELRLEGVVVKRFTRPAGAQEVILSAFQEEGWPSVIDDPLPAQFNQDPKRRLHYTIRNLNRGQRPLCIRFFINGNGERIRWECVAQPCAGKTRRTGQPT